MTFTSLHDVHQFPVRTHADLGEAWSCLMGDGGFGRRSLWLIPLHPDGMIERCVVPIDDVPVQVRPAEIAQLASMVAEIVRLVPGVEVAALLSRPGPATMADQDRRWAQAVAPLTPQWPVHLATRGRIQVFAPDDLIPTGATS